MKTTYTVVCCFCSSDVTIAADMELPNTTRCGGCQCHCWQAGQNDSSSVLAAAQAVLATGEETIDTGSASVPAKQSDTYQYVIFARVAQTARVA